MASSSPKYETKSRSVSGSDWMSRRTYSASKLLRCTMIVIIQACTGQRADCRVDRRKRLSHVWGRRFRLPTDFLANLRVRAQASEPVRKRFAGGPAEHREEGRPYPRFIAGALISSAAGGPSVSPPKKKIARYDWRLPRTKT